MAKKLLGKEVNEALVAALQKRTAALREKGVVPTLGIIRLGENPSDLSYEKGATKRAEEVGVAVKNFILPESTTKEELLDVIDQAGGLDAGVRKFLAGGPMMGNALSSLDLPITKNFGGFLAL